MLQNSHTFQAGAEPTETRKYTPRLPSKLNLAVVGIAAVVLAELFAPNQYKPSTLIGGFVGHEEAVDLRTKLEAAQATIAAQNQENARMQQEVEWFRAHTERVTLAYKALYDRANILAQSMVGLQQKYLEMRQEVVTQLESGNKSAAVLGDLASIAGALMGNEEIANKAHAVAEYSRNQVMSKFDEETRRGTAQMSAVVDNWKVGIPDPAVMVAEERAAPIIPAPRSQPPMQSVVYRERQSASAVRLARVSNHFHNVFVRTEPRGERKPITRYALYHKARLSLLSQTRAEAGCPIRITG